MLDRVRNETNGGGLYPVKQRKMSFQKLPKKEEEQSTELLHGRASKAQRVSASSPSINGRRKVSHADIELVQKLIERCLVLYMTKDEAVSTLVTRGQLEPHFITLVWQRLEEENPEFFSAYNVQLVLKKQITLFNQLLEQQYHLMSREYRSVTPPSFNNSLSHMPVKSSFGYPSQQPYLPSRGASNMEPLCYGSRYHVVDGIPAAGNFYSNPPNIYAACDNHEMDIDPYDQFLFEPDEIQSCIQPMAFGATFPFNTCKIEGFQPAVDGGSGSSSDNLVSHCNLTNNLEELAALQSYQSALFPMPDIVNIMGESPEECDIVNYFIADAPCLEPKFGIGTEKS
ncbi:hypothetical protein SOVF_173700 [Spinacia oleracea]|uniref:Uncharacterized protein LOC110780189 isoform X2 n=1 Tax=Spinacia oleracea TaxID=3562 RepID=A0A9R0I2H8_SPIOL|nr:uncharacterized protein LOC110780189 isoform X2 [Spinacia oleracea]XP_056694386.1 uncharacterized protein LOC110780189 isoform X2 [Spinacia oleracea]KNA07245.1 hypothetical protein SOVF_173700 [Spinacia oleracea]